ncbi:MFS polyamine transporter [Cylindrobasidium torrendii FP15055 ss-10]|uniref:MFS polyamine transporter n=1 Tax=Cylindrobasidium torrendii FP15055 ss-10 TaxID=1314674 RepID=A0A0D7B6L3_9AGAR|nr:MFS polyamine transporter [Cylindrobasidium torrendii FP15055 ss-10]
MENRQLESTGSTASVHDGVEKVDAPPPKELVVDWDGPDDPENPKNWTYSRKWRATVVVSLFTFVSPVASSMLAPAVMSIGADLGIHKEIILSMTISIFVLAYAVGPLFLGPLSELYGRAIVLQLCNLFFLAWCLGCGFAQTEGQLLAFRFLSGLGGSAPLAVGGGTLGDMWAPEQRGKAIAIYSMGPLLGPVVGPIAGGWIAEKTTWRWVFWSTCIFDVVVQVVGFMWLRETYAPVLLERKAKGIRQRQDLENGGTVQVRTIYDAKGSRDWKQLFSKALIRPFALFFTEPIAQIAGVFQAFIFGVMYLFLTSIASIFQNVYHQRIGIAGLHYISLGLGLMIAAQINARAMDAIFKSLKAKNGGVGKPEFRAIPMIPGTIILPAGIFIAGWCADQHTHWIGVDVGLALLGGGMILVFQSMQAYIVDVYTLYAASALAAVSFWRSIAGFAFPLFAPAMWANLGYGKGATVLACVSIAIGCPAPFLFWKYGETVRKRSKFSA